MPNAEISFLGLSKLEESSVNIPVLSKLESVAENFKDVAGFSLIRKHNWDMSLACEYIESWKAEKTPLRKPVWSVFLEVLREIGLDNLAEEIDDFLKKTSLSIEPATEECMDGRSHNCNNGL